MAAPQPTTQRYGAKITTVDPTQGIIEAVTKDGSIRRISVYSIHQAFEWPVVGDSWMIEQMNGSWYLEGRFPNSTTYQEADPGDIVMVAPTGMVRVTTDGGSFDYVLMEPGRIILQAGPAPEGFVPCNGAQLDSTIYAALMNVLYPGDTSATFPAPDMPDPVSGVHYYIKC